MSYEEINPGEQGAQTETTDDIENIDSVETVEVFEDDEGAEEIEDIVEVEEPEGAEVTEGTEEAEGSEESEGIEDAEGTGVVSGENKVENEEIQVTEDDLDNIADTAIAVLQDILKYFNVGEVMIDEYVGDDGELILDITGDDLAVLIGRHGKTLEALQFLISAITVRSIGFRYPVVVDVEGYKSRQRQKLESIARSSAKRAISQHENVSLRPMTPYERRLVHIALRDDDRVETHSEGEGAARHVVIFPK